MRDGLQNGKSYTIVEDYLDSIPLQTMQLGDQLSVDGYLINDNQSLVMPSKVYRPKDGVVLGADTFLLVDPLKIRSDSDPLQASIGARNDITNSPLGIATTSEAPFTIMAGEPYGGNEAMPGLEASITDSADSSTMVPSEAADVSATIADFPSETKTSAPYKKAPNVPNDKTSLPDGFVLHFPDDVSNIHIGANQSGSIADDYNDSALRTARILIITNSERGSNSFPVSITGKVTEKNSMNNQDLVIQQGLINDELQHLFSRPADVTDSYTLSSQMTTGKYYLRVVKMAEPKMTLIGSISLYSIKDMNGMMNTFHMFLFITELLLLLMALYFYSRIIAKPLVAMNDVALKIAHQDFVSKVDITTRDEIGTLGQSINTISTNLEHRIMDINAINDRLQMDYERQVELQKRHRELSATFSHELKTPLTIMRGCIDNIQNTSNPAELVEYNSIALHELDRAGNLITQMLEIARMESPYFALHKSEIDLWMIFFKVYDELRQTIEQRGMRVDYVAGDEAFVYADAELMERVISNVMTNAMKYSPQGSTITIQITRGEKQNTFTIINSNSSIPPEDLEKIWQPFYRGTKPRTDTASGSGLGLMIVGSILNAHGFQYGIRNIADGVEFSFTCPIINRQTDYPEDARQRTDVRF